MKRLCLVLTILAAMQGASAQELISLEDFKKKNSVERAEIIAKTPPAQKAEFGRIHVHLQLLDQWGSDEALRRPKEIAVSSARGFYSLNRVQDVYENLWNSYVHAIIEANRKTGMTPAQLTDIQQTLQARETASLQRIESMHSLVYHLAPTPQAFALANKAGVLARSMFPSTITMNGFKPAPVRKEEVIEAGKRIELLIEQLKQLPPLSTVQLQKEYDDFPESNML